jgi:hypothetical protein
VSNGKYRREPSASFVVVIERGWTYMKLFERAVEFAHLDSAVLEFVRVLLQAKKRITGIVLTFVRVLVQAQICRPWEPARNGS